MGLHQAALVDLDAVLHDDPDNPIANLTRGETLTWCGEHEQGLELIRKSVRLEPAFTRLMEGLEKGWRSLETEFGDAHVASP